MRIWQIIRDPDARDRAVPTDPSQDPLCPREEQAALIAAIAGSRLVVYPGVGHNSHWEEPERFAADLVASIDRMTG